MFSFNAEMIDVLSFAVVPNDMELWLSSIEYLLYKLRKKIKKKSSDRHQNEGAASELILTSVKNISKTMETRQDQRVTTTTTISAVYIVYNN